MSDNALPKGFWVNYPHENAPDFIKCGVVIIRDEFIAWLMEQEVNEKGAVKLTVAESQGGKLYPKLDTYKPPQRTEQPQEQAPAFEDNHIGPIEHGELVASALPTERHEPVSDQIPF